MKYLLFIVFILFINFFATSQIVNIPDPNFKAGLLNQDPAVDTNGDGEIQYSEAESYFGQLTLDELGISDLTGIEAFINLDRLFCRKNNLTEITLTPNDALSYLYLDYNQIEDIDVTGFPNLVELNLNHNELTELNVTQNPSLLELRLNKNILQMLDISQNTELKYLSIYNNYFTTLDITNNTELERIDARKNDLISFNSGVNNKLFRLSLEDNNLSTIDLGNFSNLYDLSIYNNNLTSLDTSQNPILAFLSLNNNDLNEINVSNNLELRILSLNFNNIQNIDISNNEELESLSIKDNLIEGIEISQNLQLNYLDISNNSITALNLSNHDLMRTLDCSNNLINNLILNDGIHDLNCSNNEISILDISQISFFNKIDCSKNNIAELDFSNVQLVKEINCSDNNIQELDLSNFQSHLFLYISNNPISNIDLTQNDHLQIFHFNNTLLTELDLSNNWSICQIIGKENFELKHVNMRTPNNEVFDPAINCSNNSIDTFFDLRDNPNLEYLCVEDIDFAAEFLTNVPPITTYIEDCSLANNNLNNITGLLKYDADVNGCESSDDGLEGLMVNTTDGTNNFASSSSEIGYYNLNVSEDIYTTTVLGLPPYFSLNPLEAISEFVGFDQTETVDFCVTPINTANDLAISLVPLEIARPGFETSYRIIYENMGTTQLSGTIELQFDGTRLSFIEAIPNEISQTDSSLTWDYGTIKPFENGSIDIEFSIAPPPTNVSGDILGFISTGNPVSTDETPNNNTFTLNQEIINSFDPNDKRVLQGNQVLFDNANKYLNYIVRFQNTGTASAINVRVRDLIDEKLDWTSLRVLDQSHDVKIEMVNGELDFIFDNINLPTEDSDPEGSQGFVTYKIKPRPEIALNDVVENTASIYFDYNPAIVTNTVSTTFVDELEVEDINPLKVVVFPNPVEEKLYIESFSPLHTIEAKNILGQTLIHKKVFNKKVQFSTSSLAAGTYFIKVTAELGNKMFQIIKK